VDLTFQLNFSIRLIFLHRIIVDADIVTPAWLNLDLALSSFA